MYWILTILGLSAAIFPGESYKCPTLYNVECFGEENPTRGRDFAKTPKSKLLDLWENLDNSIWQSCQEAGEVTRHIVFSMLKDEHEPGYCSVNKICNATICLELGGPSHLFTEKINLESRDMRTVYTHANTKLLGNGIRPRVVKHERNANHVENKADRKKKIIHDELSFRRRRDTCHDLRSKALTANEDNMTNSIWDEPFTGMQEQVALWERESQPYFDDYCNNKVINDLVIEIDGLLDFFCSHLALCSNSNCLLYSPTALKYGTVTTRTSCVATNSFLMPVCSLIEIDDKNFLNATRRRRRPANFPYQLRFSQGGLFNVPFHKFCGPGTDVIAEDDAGGPVSETDNACRWHDIAYMIGDDPIEADRQLLTRLYDAGSVYYYPFSLAIQAKQAFEAYTGKRYTSLLYVTPSETAATFSHYFYFKSVFDGLSFNRTKLNIIKEKEEKWKNIILDIWRGHCYVQKRPGSDTREGTPTREDPGRQPSTSGSASTNPENTDEQDEYEDDVRPSMETEYPSPPETFAPCRIVINEILTKGGDDSSSFIELKKVCPKNLEGRKRVTKLTNYMLAVIKAGDPPILKIMVDLNKQALTPITKYIHTSKGARNTSNYYFVVGLGGDYSRSMRLQMTPGGRNGIPPGSMEEETYSVVLLRSASLLKTVPSYKRKLPHPMTEDELESFEIALQDIVTYGAPCNLRLCSTFVKWNIGLVPLEDEKTVYPIADATKEGDENKSLSRCTESEYPMQQECWELTQPSPLQENICSVVVTPLYTFGKGASIQSSAQYVIMNVQNFFLTYKEKNDPVLLEGSELDITARATGVSRATVRRINTRHSEGRIKTPRGRKRKRICRAICRFTAEDKNHVLGYIKNQYKKNLPPFFENIYANAQEYFRNSSRIMCGAKTFKKLLYMMGFYYGRIDALSVLLERPDIVAKRAVYLKKMRENDKSEKPKPVIYTDESWVDPHARSGKAWVPRRNTMEHEERLKFGFQKHQTNRGKRIIMLHAAGPDGLIHNSEYVQEVGGSKLSPDYHDNIESEFYMNWFRQLCINVNETYGSSIIVIDNAPYHTKSDAPKSNAKKQDLLDYLIKVDVYGELTGFDNSTKYYRWQLWEMVMRYKKENTDHYLIDRLAIEYGHMVLRLPPHQCNFNPIEMLWHLTKDHARKHNENQTIESVKKLVKDFFILFPAEEWRKLVEHTDRLREEYWITDKLYENFLDTHEERIGLGPVDVDEQEDRSDEDGPLDAYLHAGDEIQIDENGDII